MAFKAGWSPSVVAAVCFPLAACSPGASFVSEKASEGCAAGDIRGALGHCRPAGLPPLDEMACPPGEVSEADGSCRAAGVPKTGCAKGFAWNNGGCDAILPKEPCAPGEMALPGDTQCHPVAACGDGTYGDIPINEPNTMFVDASYVGLDADGSIERPFSRINDAISAAAPGAIVAIAAGSYSEEIFVEGKPVQLWGRCPGMVELTSPDPEPISRYFLHVHGPLASGSTIRSLSVSAKEGIEAVDAGMLNIEDVWINAGMYDAIDARSTTNLQIRNMLVEGTRGIYVDGANAEIEGLVMREIRYFGVGAADTNGLAPNLTLSHSLLELKDDKGPQGVQIANYNALIEGVVMRPSPNNEGRFGGIRVSNQNHAKTSIKGCTIEDAAEWGITLESGDVAIESTTIRRTRKTMYDGIGIRQEPLFWGDTIDVRDCLIEDSASAGITIAGANLHVDSSIIRGTSAECTTEDDRWCAGIAVLGAPTPDGTIQTRVRNSVIEGIHGNGVFSYGTDLRVEDSLIRSTRKDSDGKGGNGVLGMPIANAQKGSIFFLRSLAENNATAGIAANDVEAHIEASAVRSTSTAEADCENQSGVLALWGAHVAIVDSLLENNCNAALGVLGGSLKLDTSIVRGTHPAAGKGFADGLFISPTTTENDPQTGKLLPSNASISRCLFEGNARAGIANFGSDVLATNNTFRSNGVDIDGEDLKEAGTWSFDGSYGNLCEENGELGECVPMSAQIKPLSIDPNGFVQF